MFVTLGCIYQSSCIPHACKHAAPCRVNTGSLNWFRICSFQGTVAGFLTKALVGLSRLELPTSRLSGVRSNRLSYKPVCCFQHSLPTAWRRRDSNSRPPACKAGALPTELCPQINAWHPPILPCSHPHSTVGRKGLNRRVRDGNGCYPFAHRHQANITM